MVKGSSWRRAWNDTEAFRRSVLFFWVVEVMGAAFFAGLGGMLMPANPSKFASIAYPGLGFIAGFFVAFFAIYGWNFARAPYRHRDELWLQLQRLPAPVPLRNRDALVRAISKYELAACHVVAVANTNDPVVAEAVLNEAWEELWHERQVAGDPFEKPINGLTTFVQLQILLRQPGIQIVGNLRPLGPLEFTGRLQGIVAETIRSIDAIAGVSS